MFAIKALFIVNMIWQTATIVTTFFKLDDDHDFQLVSNNGFFLLIRLSGCTAMVLFLVVGIIIRKKISALPRETQYEKEIAEKQDRAIQRLWVVIKWFMALTVILMVYDIVSFFTTDRYGNLKGVPKWVDELFLIFIRTIAYVVFAIPIFYLFWPSIISKSDREKL